MNTPVTNIDEYISGFPLNVQVVLEQVRDTIRKAAPNAKESIKYRMPCFSINGDLVYFAAFKNHIGLYPLPSGIEMFIDELSVYKMGKGSVQFPLNKVLPLDLIERIVLFRIKQDSLKIKAKCI